MYLTAAIQLYFEHAYNLTPRTKEIYQEHLNRLTTSLEDRLVEEITERDLSRFMSNLLNQKGEKYSPGYQDQIWRTLHTFFGYCVSQGWQPANPMDGVRRPELETGDKPRLSLSQIEQLLSVVATTDQAERNAAIVLLMVDSGLRIGEVANLRLFDIDFDDNSAYVKSTKVRKKRNVPLTDKTIAAIKEYLKKRGALASKAKGLFLTARGPRKGEDISRKAIEELMKRLQKKLSFPLYAHLLRHTFANHYIRVGELKKLSQILGHSRIDTTARFYTNPAFKEIKEEHKLAAPTAQLAELLLKKTNGHQGDDSD